MPGSDRQRRNSQVERTMTLGSGTTKTQEGRLGGSAARRLGGSAARRLGGSAARRLGGSAARRLGGSAARRLGGSAARRLGGSAARRLGGSAARRLGGSAARRLGGSAARRLGGSAARRLGGSAARRLGGSAARRLGGSAAVIVPTRSVSAVKRVCMSCLLVSCLRSALVRVLGFDSPVFAAGVAPATRLLDAARGARCGRWRAIGFRNPPPHPAAISPSITRPPCADALRTARDGTFKVFLH